MMITAWFLVSLIGTPAPIFSPPMATEAECLKVKEWIDDKKFSSASKCMQLKVLEAKVRGEK
jgi:hypothetical protein